MDERVSSFTITMVLLRSANRVSGNPFTAVDVGCVYVGMVLDQRVSGFTITMVLLRSANRVTGNPLTAVDVHIGCVRFSIGL